MYKICWHGCCERRYYHSKRDINYLAVSDATHREIESSEFLKKVQLNFSQYSFPNSQADSTSTKLVQNFFVSLVIAPQLYIVLSNDLSKFEPFLYFKKTITSLSKFCQSAQLQTAITNRSKLSGPLAAILNFALKCKQTAISQELSIVNKFCLHIFYIS